MVFLLKQLVMSMQIMIRCPMEQSCDTILPAVLCKPLAVPSWMCNSPITYTQAHKPTRKKPLPFVAQHETKAVQAGTGVFPLLLILSTSLFV